MDNISIRALSISQQMASYKNIGTGRANIDLIKTISVFFFVLSLHHTLALWC